MQVTTDGDGRAVKVGGDPDHPITQGWLCGKVSNYLDRVYSDERLLHPLIRDGATGERAFRQAGWEEALDLVAERLRATISSHGGEAVLPYSYYGTMGFVQADMISARFMNAIGSSRLARTICATGGMAGVMSTTGPSAEVDPELWPHARFLVVWAWNPMSTAPHLWRKLLEARRNGARLVVIDPYRSRTARVADQHIQPLPGTDAALALAMMRAIVDEDLQDEQWCREYCDGYDDLLARLAENSVGHWAETCGVEAETIRSLARDYATSRPALLRLGVGGQRHLGGPIAYRTIACLPALVGAWKQVGGGLSYIPTATAGAIGSDALKGGELRERPAREINMSQIGDALTNASLDPPVKALVVWNSNPVAVAPDQTKVLAGLKRDDLFTVVIEQFMTDTAALADVVLPATTQLEHLDALFSWGHHYVTMNEPAIEPLGEAKPNSEIFRLLAARMGLDHPSFTQTDEQILEELFEGSPGGFTLAQLRERGWCKVDLGQGELPHAAGGFITETGKLGLSAGWLERDGIDVLPFFDPPAEATDSRLAKKFPLAMVTPKTHLFLNSTFANQQRQHSAQAEPFVVIHPQDAAPRSIDDGEFVRVHNDRGAFSARVRVSDEARRGVLVAPMGWWNDDYPDGLAPQATTSQRLTKLGEAPTFNDNRVEVEAA